MTRVIKDQPIHLTCHLRIDSLFPDQIGPIIDLPFTLPEIFDAKGIGMNYDVELG